MDYDGSLRNDFAHDETKQQRRCKCKLNKYFIVSIALIAICTSIGAIVGAIYENSPTCCLAEWYCESERIQNYTITALPCKGVVDCEKRYDEYVSGCNSQLSVIGYFALYAFVISSGISCVLVCINLIVINLDFLKDKLCKNHCDCCKKSNYDQLQI